METFSASLALCAGKFPAQKSVTRSFDVFFDLRLNKQLGKQWNGDAGDLRRHRAYDDVIVTQEPVRHWTGTNSQTSLSLSPCIAWDHSNILRQQFIDRCLREKTNPSIPRF